MWPRPRPLALVLGLSPACQAPQADTSPFPTTAPLTAPASSDDEGTGASSGSGSGSTTELSTASASSQSSGGTTLILDVGSAQDLGDGKPAGCKGKIDFLFVISRYAGMSYFQEQLLAAFPNFIDTIEEKFADFDYHIMVVDGDAEWGFDDCTDNCPTLACKVGEPCCSWVDADYNGQPCCGVADYPCDQLDLVTTCDTTLGAGVVFPAGYDASNKPCGIDGGRRYMVTGQTDLKETFACTAQVGTNGIDLIGETLVAALQSNINDPGGCNPGFLRKDALLMVTLISNTYDQESWIGSKGTPATWTEAVRNAKGGVLSSVVMLSILDASHEPGCHPEDRTCQMVKMFPYSLIANRDDDYGPPFDKATDLISNACAGFVPPG